jgi:hypothetical protein
MPFNDFLFALVATIIVEVSVGLLLGYRRAREVIAIVLVNVVTNPSLNYLLVANERWHLFVRSTASLLGLEAIIVVVEWALLMFALPYRKRRNLFVLSFVMNSCSCIAGAIVYPGSLN